MLTAYHDDADGRGLAATAFGILDGFTGVAVHDAYAAYYSDVLNQDGLTHALFVKLYGPAEHQDELLTGALGRLCSMAASAGLADAWFFIRYADPEPHLRMRWHG